MVLRTRSIRIAFTAVAALLTSVSVAHAQELKGVVRNIQRGDAVGGATVTMQSVVGDTVLATARSDSSGRFTLPLRSGPDALPVLLITQRLGFKPDTVELMRAPSATFEIFLQDVAQALEAREISAPQTRNQQAYDEAVRRGWRVYGPEKVAEYRERAGSLTMLVRMVGVPGLVPARSPMDCIRSIRNQYCMTLIVDGVNAGTTGYVNPADIEFFAVMNQSESRIHFGERAPYGAIVIYTRSAQDATDLGRRRRRP